jgi:hypothetical protein
VLTEAEDKTPEDVTDPSPKGSSKAYIAKLEKENFNYRRDRANLREENAALKAKVPADGAVVLSADDAKAWEAYKALGKPDDLKNSAKLSQTDAADLARFRKAEVAEKAGEIAKFKPSLLGRLISADGLTLEFGTEKKDGKDVPIVSVKGADGKLTPLADYAENHWGDALPALQADSNTQVNSSPSPAPKSVGTPPRAVPRSLSAIGTGDGKRLPDNYEQLLSSGRYNT